MFFMPWVCYKITPMSPFFRHDLLSPMLIGNSRNPLLDVLLVLFSRRMKMSPGMMTISLQASAHVFFIFSLFMLIVVLYL